MLRISFVVLAITLLAGFTTGCASDRHVIDQAASVHTQLDPAVIDDPDIAGYLNKIGGRIIEAAYGYHIDTYGEVSDDDAWLFSPSLRFHLVDSEVPNAFTTGGEHMYIYNELFQQSETEDELAAVMSHEYAHVYARHVHRGMNRRLGLGIATLGVGVIAGAATGDARIGAAAGGATAVGGGIIVSGFTRGDEAEADALGFEFYVRAGWDPDRFDDFFQRMIELGHETNAEFLSDHPSLASRVEAAQARAAALPPQAQEYRQPAVASGGRYESLQSDALAYAERNTGGEELDEARTILSAFPSCIDLDE